MVWGQGVSDQRVGGFGTRRSAERHGQSLKRPRSQSLNLTPQQNMREEAAQPLTASDATYLLHSVDAFLFDCDGVIWKGDTLIDGVPQTLDLLRSKGKKLVFVTNNSTKSRRQYATKFHSLGIPVYEDEIFSSSFAAAMYLKSIEFPRDKKVYVVGGEGILEELQLAGFTGLGGPEDGKKMVDLKENYFFEHDRDVRAVVVGLDPYINYYKIQYATLCIRENPECLFIATNRDAVGHMTYLQEWPGAGCMVAAVCGSTQKEPVVVGKPSTFMMEFLIWTDCWLQNTSGSIRCDKASLSSGPKKLHHARLLCGQVV